jgi:hypothetical protein
MEMITLLAALVAGLLIGAGLILLYDNRIKKMHRRFTDYAQATGLVKSHEALQTERDELLKKVEMQAAEILTYRKQMVTWIKKDQARDAQIKKLEQQSKSQREEMEQMRKNEDERFGRLVRLLNKQGITLTQQDLNELTP